jgi:hypothetical protein
MLALALVRCGLPVEHIMLERASGATTPTCSCSRTCGPRPVCTPTIG